MLVEARSQDFSWWGGGGVRMGSEDAKLSEGPGVCAPSKILDCLRLHFARFHGGEREKENVEQLKEKVDRQSLIV